MRAEYVIGFSISGLLSIVSAYLKSDFEILFLFLMWGFFVGGLKE